MNFSFLRPTFTFYTIYILHCVHIILHEINVWNMWWKLKKLVIQIEKNWIKLFFKKGSLLIEKGTFVWQNDSSIIQKGRWRSNPPNQKLFLTLSIQIKKSVFVCFFQKCTFQLSIQSHDNLTIWNRPWPMGMIQYHFGPISSNVKETMLHSWVIISK